MADEFSKIAFDQDLEEVLALPEAERWKIERIGDLEIPSAGHPPHEVPYAPRSSYVYRARVELELPSDSQ